MNIFYGICLIIFIILTVIIAIAGNLQDFLIWIMFVSAIVAIYSGIGLGIALILGIPIEW